MRVSRRLELVAFTTVILAGALLRWVHLGTASLWWDEIVEIQTATVGGLGDVLREVRLGIPPGAGNAGAMPLDYLLLHLYLRVVPPPAPAHLEVYFRLPAFLYSVAALVVLAGFARRCFDRDVALLGTLLLALSLPHVLYAAEVRFYALFVLVTLGNLWAFAHLLDHLRARRAWLVYLVVSVLYVLTGLLGLLLVGLQYVLLAGALLRRPGGARRILPWLASGAVLGLLVSAYFTRSALTAQYPRSAAAALDPWHALRDSITFFALDRPALAGLWVLVVPFALMSLRRRFPGRGELAAVLVLGFLAIPVVVLLARWKHYYFHVRHVLFLLPAYVLLAALGILGGLRMLDPFARVLDDPRRRRRTELLVGVLIVLATHAPVVRAYLARPDAFFARTKTLYDMRGLMGQLALQVERLPPGESMLVLAERQSIPNAALSRYLRWYGLDGRVVLRSTTDVPAALVAVGRGDATPGELTQAPFVRPAVGLTPQFRRLLDLETPIGPAIAGVRHAVVIVYSPVPPDAARGPFVQRSYLGFATLETR